MVQHVHNIRIPGAVCGTKNPLSVLQVDLEVPGMLVRSNVPQPLDGGNDVMGVLHVNRLTRRFQPVGGLRLIDRGGVAHYLPLYLSARTTVNLP